MNSDIPDVGHSKTGMGVRGIKPTVVEALKRGASRTLAYCVGGTPNVSSWLSVVICESYTSSSDGPITGSSVVSWGYFGVGSLIFIPELTTCIHEKSVDLHNIHCMCSSNSITTETNSNTLPSHSPRWKKISLKRNIHFMCSSKLYYHRNEFRYFTKSLTKMEENCLEILSLSLFFSSPENLKSSPHLEFLAV
jgi:hypothetical protein